MNKRTLRCCCRSIFHPAFSMTSLLWSSPLPCEASFSSSQLAHVSGSICTFKRPTHLQLLLNCSSIHKLSVYTRLLLSHALFNLLPHGCHSHLCTRLSLPILTSDFFVAKLNGSFFFLISLTLSCVFFQQFTTPSFTPSAVYHFFLHGF